MIEVRFHGRGGQGAVTSAELMAIAAIGEGKYAQAFPSFGPERRGAPVQTFLRISDMMIRLREQISTPDIVVVLDPALVRTGGVTVGIKKNGTIVVNSSKLVKVIRDECGYLGRIAMVDATKIAKEELGVAITNTTMLGALLKAVTLVDIESLKEPLNMRFGKNAEKNQKALRRAFSETRIEE